MKYLNVSKMIVVLIAVALLVLTAVMLQVVERKAPVKRLEGLMPVLKVERDLIINKNGDVTAVFAVELPEVFSLSTAEFEVIHQAWIKAIKVLPAGTVFHKQDWFIHQRFAAPEKEEESSFLSAASDRHFFERPFLEHECFVMITRKSEGRKPSASVVSNLLRTNMVAPAALSEQLYNEFTDKLGQFRRILSDGGFIGVTQLTSDRIASTAKKPGLLERYMFLLAKGEQAIIPDITFRPTFQVGPKHCQTFVLSDAENLPANCGSRITYDPYSTDRSKFPVSFAAPLGQLLACDHIYNQIIVVDDPARTLKGMEAKRRRLHSLSNYSRENAISRDATNAFLNEAISQARTPVKAHFNLVCWSEDPTELKEIRNQVSTAITQLDAQPRLEQHSAPTLYWASMPGNASDLGTHETFDTFTEQAACFLTQESSYRDSVSDMGMRLVDRHGKPVWVDLSDMPMRKGWTSNRNKCIFGGSGSGKSLFTCGLVRSYYEGGAHTIVVDVGGSYTGICQLLGGYYFSYTESNPIKFNPFYISEGDFLDTEKKESLKTLLVALWKREDEGFRRSEYVALSNALHLYYDKLSTDRTIFPCFNSFYEFLRDEYSVVLDGQQVKEKEFDINNFLYVLAPYYKGGEFSFLLNATEKLDVFHQRLVVYELDNLKDHPILFAVTTLVIMEQFISKMRKLRGIRKVIVIEEAWKAIAKSAMAEFLRYLYKTVRKFFGEAIVVSQEVGDIISSPIIKDAIINNADCKILLDVRKFQNKFDQLQDVLGMTDKGKQMVLSINKANDPKRKYREVFVDFGGAHMKVYGFEPSREEYFAYTTEEREKLMVAQFTEQCHGDMRKGIKALIAHLEAKG